ncbi:Solute carrier family 22 member 5, partial [Araneus ventricosus]
APYYCGTYLTWIAGALHLPLIAWWLRDWIWIEFVLILPSVVVLATWWLLPESPRWLLTQGKTEEALKILSKAAKRNGLEISDIKLKEMVIKLKQPNDTENTGINVLDLFKSELRLRTFVLWFIWCATAFVYYGISYNTNELAGDPFVNFALSFAMEIPVTILALIAIQYKGRRMSLAVSLLFAGVACLLVYPIPEVADYEVQRTSHLATTTAIGRSEANSLKVIRERDMSRGKYDFWSFLRCWGSFDLWKDEVDVPSSVIVVPFILPELVGDGMEFLLEVAPWCWILCWNPLQGGFLCEEIRCLVILTPHSLV